MRGGVGPPHMGGAANSFSSALERARSISRERESSVSETSAAPGEQASQMTWADRVVGGDGGAGGVKRPRPGAIDGEGFWVPGRPARKAVPRGTSTADLSTLGGAVAVPIDRYVGNTGQDMTPALVKEALMMCAAVLPGGPTLGVQINSHLQNARTRAWKLTVPYRCREIVENGALYPPGWTHRAYFAPRQDRIKRARAGQQPGLNVVPTLLQGEERANMAKKQVEEDRVTALVETALAKRDSEAAGAAVLLQA